MTTDWICKFEGCNRVVAGLGFAYCQQHLPSWSAGKPVFRVLPEPRWLRRITDPQGEGATSGVERDWTGKAAA